ncbi:MAG: hypothetical protein MUE40_14470 [Anaerolineae bacterium]|jgi:hypothetical protein|nr:hypothetical protein [Anaerolineae bacterium]
MPFPAEFSGYVTLLLLGGVFFIGYGLLYIAGKPLMWRWQGLFRLRRGKAAPHRTAAWDRRTTRSGAGYVFIGALALFFALFVPAALQTLTQSLP